MENGAMEETDLKWRKASYSSNGGGNCVEVGKGGRVLVRDTKDRTGPVLRLSPAAWRRFADQVKRSLAPARTTKAPAGHIPIVPGPSLTPAARIRRGPQATGDSPSPTSVPDRRCRNTCRCKWPSDCLGSDRITTIRSE
jgi:hypothetical protein